MDSGTMLKYTRKCIRGFLKSSMTGLRMVAQVSIFPLFLVGNHSEENNNKNLNFLKLHFS